jgi:class 3 adenylate cyclase
MDAVDLGFQRPATTHRVKRMFGFIDLSGFTHFTVAQGDDRAVEQLSEFRRIVRAAGSATGVRVAKWLGDGAMLVSVDSASLVIAVMRIMRAMRESDMELPLHAGVCDGNVILFEGDDHIGVAVNLAARLAALAEPWQILAPADMFPGVARTKAVIGPVQIEGFDEPIVLADLALVPQLVEALNL